MRRSLYLLTLLLLLLAPNFLLGATFWDGVKVPIGNLVGIVLTVVGVPFLMKWTRKMGLEITDAQANAAIDALINILINIDLSGGKATSEQKKQQAVLTAAAQLPPEMHNILTKKYGSMEAAVQVAYERSSLNNKAGK